MKKFKWNYVNYKIYLFVLVVCFGFCQNKAFSQCACLYYNSAGVFTCILYSNCSGPNLTACGNLTTAITPKLCTPSNPCPQSAGMNWNCGGCIANGACWYNGTACNASTACSEINAIIALPVDLVEFNGGVSDLGNEISWSTSSEWHSSHFNIEYSIDGVQFTNLYSIATVGNSTEIQRYSFTHVDFDKSQINYYRLTQVDIDGKFKTYDPISIDNREIKFNSTFSEFYPNPSNDIFYFQYGGKNFDSEINITILNTFGEVVFSKDVKSFNKYQGIPISTSDLNNGIYQVQIRQVDDIEIKKIIVVH